MKPSRALYLLTGAAIVASAHGAWPGSGAFLMFVALLSGVLALSFDWNDA
jgi:hypothetical protein